eukprot:IDg80t1
MLEGGLRSRQKEVVPNGLGFGTRLGIRRWTARCSSCAQSAVSAVSIARFCTNGSGLGLPLQNLIS